MPASFETFRARCGSFLWTYLYFMARRQGVGVLGARYSGVMFVPRHCGVNTKQCLRIQTDFPPVFFSIMYYSSTEADNTGSRKLGLGRTGLAAVFLLKFLLMCMDIESNPGPVYDEESNTRSRQVSSMFDSGQRTISSIRTPFSCTGPHSATVSETTQHVTTDEALLRLQQIEQHYTALSSDMGSLFAWCDGLQSENDHLKKSVAHLTDQCQSLQSECDMLYDQQQHQSNSIDTLDRDVDKLEFFSKRKNVKFFNVTESPNEDYQTCTRKVVQLLNRFYPSKTWSCDDVERAHRVGPPRGDFGRPRPLIACLHRWPDKLALLQEKEHRRDLADELGIRVATDLTSRQYNELRQHREEGRNAYFHRGQLLFRKRGSQAVQNRRHSQNGSQRRVLRHHEDNANYTGQSNKDFLLPPSPSDMEEFPSLHEPSSRQRKREHAPFSSPRRRMSTQPRQLASQPQPQPQRLVSGDHSAKTAKPNQHSRSSASDLASPKISASRSLYWESAPLQAERSKSSTLEKTTDNSTTLSAPHSPNNPSSSPVPSGHRLSPEYCMQSVTCQAIVHREDVPCSPADPHVEQTSVDQTPQPPVQPFDIESQSPVSKSFQLPSMTVHSHLDLSLGGPVSQPQSPTVHDNPPTGREDTGSVTGGTGGSCHSLLSTSITHENETTKPTPQRAPHTRKQTRNKSKQTRPNNKSKQTRLITDNFHPRDHSPTALSSSEK